MNQHHSIRQSFAVSALLLAALFLLPLAVVAPFRPKLFAQEDPAEIPAEEPAPPLSSGQSDAGRLLRVLDGGTVTELDLGQYLVGVVRAEMPAAFELEALKAQAAAARTYTLYKLQTGGNHGETADICTDSTCCQAYISGPGPTGVRRRTPMRQRLSRPSRKLTDKPYSTEAYRFWRFFTRRRLV